MPKDTFYNLKEEKRLKIYNAAVSEFAEYGFANASVNRIVKTSGIATGSFYQYFDDIKDLFFYVITDIGAQKSKYISDGLSKIDTQDFEASLKAIYRAGIQFSIENQDSCKIANSIMEILNTPLYSELLSKFTTSSDKDWLSCLLKRAMENNEIRKDISIELFYMLVAAINKAIVDYMGILSEKGEVVNDESKLNHFSELAISILLNGIK